MRVSAIVPVRNMQATLGRALESLLKQTHPVDEIIVADDLSTDDSTNVAGIYEGVKIISNPGTEPWGICGGRNAALKYVTGEAVLPLDADDWIEPTYVEKTLAKLKDGVGIVSTQMRYFGDREGTIVKTWRRTYETQLKYNNITVTSLVLKEALDKAGEYDYNLKGWEDWDMWLRILKLGYTHDYVDEVLFHYHLSNQGMNAWANRNREHLIKYLTAKHPGFMEIRKTGAVDEDGIFRKEWNNL